MRGVSKNYSENDAKILNIWFNSTINILQVFLDRIVAKFLRDERKTWTPRIAVPINIC